jgi:hypothetical protein
MDCFIPDLSFLDWSSPLLNCLICVWVYLKFLQILPPHQNFPSHCSAILNLSSLDWLVFLSGHLLISSSLGRLKFTDWLVLLSAYLSYDQLVLRSAWSQISSSRGRIVITSSRLEIILSSVQLELVSALCWNSSSSDWLLSMHFVLGSTFLRTSPFQDQLVKYQLVIVSARNWINSSFDQLKLWSARHRTSSSSEQLIPALILAGFQISLSLDLLSSFT